MIPEQALFHLPEILTGTGYPRQRYEGGLVAAFSLALLQSLNGRNVPNPISCLHAERPFLGNKGWERGDSKKKRYLRTDLHLDISHLHIGSDSLASYGWRYYNWIEAKFFRRTTTNAQQNTGALLADLIRLLALVPNKVPADKAGKKRLVTGRYLLHVYESFDPSVYLSVKRQTGDGSEPRKWLLPLLTGGVNKCERIKLSDYETDGILGSINSHLGDLELEFEATTWRIGPTHDLGKKARQYVCLLSRIDAFSIGRDKARLTVATNRQVTPEPNWDGVRSDIRSHVGKWINLKDSSENQKPDLPDELDDGEE